ncbi:MAG: glycosyltransferase [Ferruginibacter sp.]|nr:glycosyltransferase [Ferruginibacter sp.]
MIRICTSLSKAGYEVTLIGTKNNASPPLLPGPYQQTRLNTWFKKGPGFYAEYNCRLFFFLLFKKADLLCCIDLDTIIPVWLASFIKNKKRVYDAHEYFSQQKEIITRPRIYKAWYWIERKFVPLFPNGYTVGNCIAAEFRQRYKVGYEIIRNIPLLKPAKEPSGGTHGKYILYQGAVNEGRGLEYLIPAMNQVDATLLIHGDGNFMEQTKNCIKTNNLANKVLLKGKLLPRELDTVTCHAYIGVNLVENIGLNQYYSLANKFFDYIHHLVPQVTMDFPEYKAINDQFEVALLVKNTEPATISNSLCQLLNDKILYERLRQNCIKAREQLNWQQEEKKLLIFYHNLFVK